MEPSRRGFLKRTLLVAGAAGAAKIATQAAAAVGEAPAAGGATTCPTCAVMPAMTPDGKLIHVCDGKLVHHVLPVLSNAAVRAGVAGRKWVMVIDLAKCDGCKQCTVACSAMHGVPADREWIKVLSMRDSHNTTPYWFPKPCFHCDNPPCTRVCPVDATFKRQDGIVLIDNERCIGCRFCMAACPYSVRFFNWGQPEEPPEIRNQPYSPEHGYPRRVGTVEKCDFCPDETAQGKLPCCTSGCPMGAIYFGDYNEDAVTNSRGETERFTKLLADRAGYRYMEDLGTEPRVFYLPPKNRMFPGPGESGAAPHHPGR